MPALRSLGYRPRAPVPLEEFAKSTSREQWGEEKGLTVFSLWHPDSPLEVDLFVREPFDFAAAYARGVAVSLESTEVNVIGLEDLLTMKRDAGRPQDLEDVRDLEALRDEERHG